MKTFRIYAAAMAVLALLQISDIQAQPRPDCNWQDKMMSEKIAFITMELNLTPKEAEEFWPIYNQIVKEKNEVHNLSMTTYKALKQAVEEGKTNPEELDRLLNDYLKAKDLCHTTCQDNAEQYRKVLPAEKVAKLYVAEEKFRRQHIRNFKGSQQGAGRPRSK